jgi:hypothetical protein
MMINNGYDDDCNYFVSPYALTVAWNLSTRSVVSMQMLIDWSWTMFQKSSSHSIILKLYLVMSTNCLLVR